MFGLINWRHFFIKPLGCFRLCLPHWLCAPSRLLLYFVVWCPHACVFVSVFSRGGIFCTYWTMWKCLGVCLWVSARTACPHHSNLMPASCSTSAFLFWSELKRLGCTPATSTQERALNCFFIKTHLWIVQVNAHLDSLRLSHVCSTKPHDKCVCYETRRGVESLYPEQNWSYSQE